MAPRQAPDYWLVQCLAAAGQSARATELYERVTAYTNDLGPLSEEANPATGELMGNFPQAFSHVGLRLAGASSQSGRSYGRAVRGRCFVHSG